MPDLSPIEAGLHAAIAPFAKPYAFFAPETAELPLATYQRISTSRPQSLKGASGIATANIQVVFWEGNAETLLQRANQFRVSILNVRGTQWGSYTVRGIAIQNESHDFESETIIGGLQGVYGVRFELGITYSEEAAS